MLVVEAVRIVGSQKILAQRIARSQQQISNLCRRAARISGEDAIAIDRDRILARYPRGAPAQVRDLLLGARDALRQDFLRADDAHGFDDEHSKRRGCG